jgi:Na+/melibiose symporter-like transporter
VGILPLDIKLSYGIGQAAEGLKNTAFGLLVLFYYNQVLEVSGTLCGLALGIALLFDAVTDPLTGSLSDNWKSKWGRRHPFMYVSAIPLAVCFYFLFAPPELSETWLFIWLTVFAVLTRAAMTLYHVPHIALGAELTSNFEERTVVVSYRQAFSTVGSLASVALAFLVFFIATDEYPNGQLNRDAYPPFALALSALMVITIWISALGTHRHIPLLPPGPANPEAFSPGRVFREAKQALSNRSFRWLFVGVIIVFLMVGVDAALNLHMNTYFWELKPGQIFQYVVALPVGVIVGTFFTRRLHAMWGKKAGVLLGTSLWAICQVMPVLLRLLDLFPENNTSELMITLIIIRFIQGFTVVQALVSFGSMVADIVDQHELKTGMRQEGIFFGAVSFANKTTTGLGTLVGGIALDVINWPTGTTIKSAADVPPETLFNLGLLFGPIVSGFAILSVWCYSHYNLTREEHQAILDALEEKRISAQAEAPESS